MGDGNLDRFKKRLLLSPPLIVAALSAPMALRLLPPNPVYGFRTAASLASPQIWYRANFWAGAAGVALGLAGAVLVHMLLRGRPVDRTRAISAAGIGVLAALASLAAGLLAS
jgi:hypothetical protein